MQNIAMYMWIVSRGHKKVSCVHVNVGIIYLFFILGTLYVVTLRKSMKKPWENKNIYRWLLYTKYKAENNALWTIYVKYGLKIYREVWKFERSGKVWNFEMENV